MLVLDGVLVLAPSILVTPPTSAKPPLYHHSVIYILKNTGIMGLDKWYES